jgi:hypothetical protein
LRLRTAVARKLNTSSKRWMFDSRHILRVGKGPLRLKGASLMFRNGIYRVGYRSPDHNLGSSEHALAVVRDGNIIGSDQLGAVFTGETGIWPTGDDDVAIELTVPPWGELINGFVAGPTGAKVKIRSRVDSAKTSQTFVVDVAGQPVEVELSYLGPLPD